MFHAHVSGSSLNLRHKPLYCVVIAHCHPQALDTDLQGSASAHVNRNPAKVRPELEPLLGRHSTGDLTSATTTGLSPAHLEAESLRVNSMQQHQAVQASTTAHHHSVPPQHGLSTANGDSADVLSPASASEQDLASCHATSAHHNQTASQRRESASPAQHAQSHQPAASWQRVPAQQHDSTLHHSSPQEHTKPHTSALQPASTQPLDSNQSFGSAQQLGHTAQPVSAHQLRYNEQHSSTQQPKEEVVTHSLLSSQPLVCLRGFTCQRPDGGMVVHDLSMRLDTGETLLVTGHSGCGKTTFVNALAGLWPHWQGHCQLPCPDQVSSI